MRLLVLLLVILNAAVLVWTLWFAPPRTEPRPPPAGGDLEPIAGVPACDEPFAIRQAVVSGSLAVPARPSEWRRVDCPGAGG